MNAHLIVTCFLILLTIACTTTPQRNDERQEIAKNPNTSPEILTMLAEDKVEYVRRMVSQNPNAPAEALTKLTDDSQLIKKNVAEHPNTPPEAFSQLLDNYNPYNYHNIHYCDIASAVATNHTTPKQALEKLFELMNPTKYKSEFRYEYFLEVVEKIMGHPNAPEYMFVVLHKEKDPFAQELMAQCPYTPLPIVKELANMPDDKISTWAKQNLQRRGVALKNN